MHSSGTGYSVTHRPLAEKFLDHVQAALIMIPGMILKSYSAFSVHAKCNHEHSPRMACRQRRSLLARSGERRTRPPRSMSSSPSRAGAPVPSCSGLDLHEMAGEATLFPQHEWAKDCKGTATMGTLSTLIDGISALHERVSTAKNYILMICALSRLSMRIVATSSYGRSFSVSWS